MSKYFVPALAVMGILSGCSTMSSVPSSSTAQVTSGALRPDVEQKADLMFQVLAGELAGKYGDLKAAAHHYEKASNIANTADLAERSARLGFFAHNWEKALKAAERWIELEPESIDARQIAGLLYVEMEQPEKAVEQFSWLIDHDEKSGGELISKLSVSLGKDSSGDTSYEVFNLLRKKYPASMEAQIAFSKLALKSQKFEEALEGANRVLVLEPDNDAGNVLKSRILLHMGRTEEALTSMRALAKSNPDSAAIHLDYARMLVQAKHYTEALAEFEKVMALEPDDLNLVYSTALLQIELGKHDEAKDQLLKLVNSKIHKDAANFYLGRIDEYQKQWATSLGWYLKVGKGEYYYDAQASSGQMLGNLGQVTQARELLQKLRSNTDDESIQMRLALAEGQVLRDAEMYKEGVEFYNQALVEYPSNIDLLYARGMMGEEIDRLDILEADMLAIIKKEPDNSTALNALGYTLADKTDRFEEALVFIKRALALRPDDPAILDSMGWVHFRMGNLTEAVNYLTKAHNLMHDAEISFHLGQVLWAAGKPDKALDTIREALKETPDDGQLKMLLRQYSK